MYCYIYIYCYASHVCAYQAMTAVMARHFHSLAAQLVDGLQRWLGQATALEDANHRAIPGNGHEATSHVAKNEGFSAGVN